MFTTLTITLIFILTKFTQVWMVFLFLPAVMYAFRKIHQHYTEIAEQLRIDIHNDKPVKKGSVIIIPVAGITRVVQQSISYAKSLTDNVIAVYVGFDDEETAKMEEKWNEWNPGVRLIVLRSSYRSILRPLIKFIDTVEYKTSDNDHVTVLIPQFITKKWWHNLLHNQTSFLIRAYLFARKDVTVTTVPYHLSK
jgi:hypothetical protein